jgi:hypothetical protein
MDLDCQKHFFGAILLIAAISILRTTGSPHLNGDNCILLTDANMCVVERLQHSRNVRRMPASHAKAHQLLFLRLSEGSGYQLDGAAGHAHSRLCKRLPLVPILSAICFVENFCNVKISFSLQQRSQLRRRAWQHTEKSNRDTLRAGQSDAGVTGLAKNSWEFSSNCVVEKIFDLATVQARVEFLRSLCIDASSLAFFLVLEYHSFRSE